MSASGGTGRLVFAYPGDIETPSGGYEYDRRIIDGLVARGWSVEPVSLGDAFPFAGTQARNRAYARLSSLTESVPVVIDGLALGVLPEASTALGSQRPLIGLVHHPLALESGLDRDTAETFRMSERQALAGTRGVIVPSPATASVLITDYDVPRARIAIVRPGTDRVPTRARRRPEGAAIRLLAVGSLVPRKGHEILLKALAGMTDLPFHLDIAGSPDFDPDCAARIREKVSDPALSQRVTLHGTVGRERLNALYQQADIFVLASRYEGYGMVFAEAIAHGIPVVATGDGAVADTVAKEAGLVFAPDDRQGFEQGLRRMLSDAPYREGLAAGARVVAETLPSWAEAAEVFAEAVLRFAQPGSTPH
ncbi:glycosyltransferase involved in cell wall biosynthesis [Breoghania corrubedonensis]|uniref:Glycosyltransferase involved in cell wall biosynthesis n=1 Tax=Breoghania corrubedonensis TaxID=665038 RepID=A0A2T5VFB3_9HYPH|nr:glycosyltransferase family 4 protein [Breoghania corrubedonensis]PTW62443.1 glycosyltransferase involved in cell wall biosynthesis [Breoghania corrubedonensis]